MEKITLELTQQEQLAVDSTSEPPRLIDPRTNKAYVLIAAASYERLKSMLAEAAGLTMKDVACLVDSAMREDDASDLTLAFYQNKYGRKQ